VTIERSQALTQKSDYGTPPEVVDICRAILGGIDLDPASSAVFNEACVKAEYYYTKEQNGLDLPWLGRVWLNPPGGKAKPRAKAWWKRLAEEHGKGQVHSAFYLSFALDTLQTTQVGCGKGVLDFPTVVFAKRLKFYVETEGSVVQTKNPVKPCALTWLPPIGHPNVGDVLEILAESLGAAGHKCIPIMRR